MEILDKKVTKKARIAQTLLAAGRWMSAPEIADAMGIDKRLIVCTMSYVIQDPRFDMDSKLMPNPVYTRGVPRITYYRCFAINEQAKKIIVRREIDALPAVGKSNGSVRHLLKNHNPLWHLALCHRFGVAV